MNSRVQATFHSLEKHERNHEQNAQRFDNPGNRPPSGLALLCPDFPCHSGKQPHALQERSKSADRECQN